MKKINGILYNVTTEDLDLYYNNNEEFWEGVKVIGSGAFKELDIKSITIPRKVEFIGANAFENCKSLTTVNLKNVRTIYDRAFSGCINLQIVIFQEGLESIGEGCFYRCRRLQEIDLPETVNEIKKGAFASSGLARAGLKKCHIKKLENNVFAKCKNLKIVKLPPSLRIIRPYASEDCIELDSLDIPLNMAFESISPNAFIGCNKLNNFCFNQYPYDNVFKKTENILEENMEI